jgi:hypothetical protein
VLSRNTTADVRKADPSARRNALVLVVLGAAVGALLIAGFEHYHEPLHNWLSSGSGGLTGCVGMLFFLVAVVVAVPLIVFAAYFWWLGDKVLRAREFPPPGYRVIRDTPIMRGQSAVKRGHGLKALAVCVGVASVVMCVLLWRLAEMVGGGN